VDAFPGMVNTDSNSFRYFNSDEVPQNPKFRRLISKLVPRLDQTELKFLYSIFIPVQIQHDKIVDGN